MAEPALSLFYSCTLDGVIPLGTWTKIESLGFKFNVTEYREGGVNGYMRKFIGPVSYENLKLSRPLDESSLLVAAWLAATFVKVVPQTMSISALDSEGNEVTQWNFSGVVPVRWSGPTLDINGNQVAIETLELAYDEMIGLGGLGLAVSGARTIGANVRLNA